MNHESIVRDRNKFQEERIKVFNHLHDIQKRLEEETATRLLFESKLNFIMYVN